MSCPSISTPANENGYPLAPMGLTKPLVSDSAWQNNTLGHQEIQYSHKYMHLRFVLVSLTDGNTIGEEQYTCIKPKQNTIMHNNQYGDLKPKYVHIQLIHMYVSRDERCQFCLHFCGEYLTHFHKSCI